jgi:hypothetical protein
MLEQHGRGWKLRLLFGVERRRVVGLVVREL